MPTPTRGGVISGGTKWGYQFMGWSRTGNRNDIISKDTIVTTASNHTLYAIWQYRTQSRTWIERKTPKTITIQQWHYSSGNLNNTANITYGQRYSGSIGPHTLYYDGNTYVSVRNNNDNAHIDIGYGGSKKATYISSGSTGSFNIPASDLYTDNSGYGDWSGRSGWNWC